MYDYSSSSNTTDPAAALASLMFMIVIGVIAYLVSSFLLYKVFKKAGRPGWAAFVPFYSYWVLFEISGKPGWWALLFIPSFIPFLGLLSLLALIVLNLLASLELAKRFGRSQVFGIFGLWLFSLIGYAILAFDDSKYQVTGGGSSPNSTPSASNPQSESNTPSQTPPSLVQ